VEFDFQGLLSMAARAAEPKPLRPRPQRGEWGNVTV
jgi:hypothetical protein